MRHNEQILAGDRHRSNALRRLRAERCEQSFVVGRRQPNAKLHLAAALFAWNHRQHEFAIEVEAFANARGCAQEFEWPQRAKLQRGRHLLQLAVRRTDVADHGESKRVGRKLLQDFGGMPRAARNSKQ